MKQLNKSFMGDAGVLSCLILPQKHQLFLPEKILQFGTGVLLRGLPDQYIDNANRMGTFKGRIVVVKSTAQGSLLAYHKQECLYSVCMRGKVGDSLIDTTYVNASISRVLDAQEDWDAIREYATSPLLEIVISNTTEVGIVYSPERIDAGIPSSYPGKLLSLLHHRYKHFNGDLKKGLIVLPTELIESNGDRLRDILLHLIDFNQLSEEFKTWFNQSMVICNTLVDRIVPGKMSDNEHKEKEKYLGFVDELMISCEPFGLWVIESSDERVKKTIEFVDEQNGCRVVPSIYKYKELKLRMLNATHTFSCALSLLAGVSFVRESMKQEELYLFIKRLVLGEILNAIIGSEISEKEALSFGNSVLDRFANPFLDHRWESISVQYPLKLKGRCIPLITAYWNKYQKLPIYMLTGLSAYLIWAKKAPNDLDEILSDTDLWGTDLNLIPGLSTQIKIFMENILEMGLIQAIKIEK